MLLCNQQTLANLQAQKYAYHDLKKDSTVLQVKECWAEAKYNAQPTPISVAIWPLGRGNACHMKLEVYTRYRISE
jgi:hypothetical protein